MEDLDELCLPHFGRFLGSHDFHDFEILTANQRIPAHRIILTLRGCKSDFPHILDLTHFKPESIMNALLYIYTGRIRASDLLQNSENLEVLRFFEVPAFKTRSNAPRSFDIEIENIEKVADIRINLADGKASASKLLLAWKSKFFNSMFTSAFCEAFEDECSLQMLTKSEFSLIYSAIVKPTNCPISYLIIDESIHYLHLAHYFCIPQLIDKLIYLIVKFHLNENTVLQFWDRALVENDDRLKQICCKYVQENVFATWCSTEDFLRLSASQFNAILRSGTLDFDTQLLCRKVEEWCEYHGEKVEDFYPPQVMFNSSMRNFLLGRGSNPFRALIP